MSLPSGYTRLEYIESTGTQYIDTGFKPNNNTRVTMDAEYLTTTGTNPVLFGARTDASSKTFVLIYTSGKFRSDYNTVYTQTWDVTAMGRRIFDKNRETTTIDGISQSYTNTAFQGDYALYLLCLNQTGTARWFATARIYSCCIYDNGTVVRDYTPCMDSLGNVGLYDAVGGNFYSNAGTGDFAAGPAAALTEVNVTVTESTDSSVAIEWEPVDGASGYRIYRDGALLDDTSGPSYTDAAPIAYARHIYTVVAYSADGDIMCGSVPGASIWPPGMPPLVTDRNAGVYYSAVDLNRVETAVQYLADRLNAAPADLKGHAVGLGVAWDALFDVPYGDIQVEAKTDWTAPDLPTRSQMARYLDNVKTVKGTLNAMYPAIPDSTAWLTYTGANNIEYVLIILRDALDKEVDRITKLLDNTAAAWYYTGDLYAGEI